MTHSCTHHCDLVGGGWVSGLENLQGCRDAAHLRTHHSCVRAKAQDLLPSQCREQAVGTSTLMLIYMWCVEERRGLRGGGSECRK